MKVVIPCCVSLITFSAAWHCGENGHIGTFPMDRMLEYMLLMTVFIEIEVPVWYDFIAETMPQCQMECFTVQYLTLMELIKKYTLESTH